jgi:hypothetical protein
MPVAYLRCPASATFALAPIRGNVLQRNHEPSHRTRSDTAGKKLVRPAWRCCCRKCRYSCSPSHAIGRHPPPPSATTGSPAGRARQAPCPPPHRVVTSGPVRLNKADHLVCRRSLGVVGLAVTFGTEIAHCVHGDSRWKCCSGEGILAAGALGARCPSDSERGPHAIHGRSAKKQLFQVILSRGPGAIVGFLFRMERIFPSEIGDELVASPLALRPTLWCTETILCH